MAWIMIRTFFLIFILMIFGGSLAEAKMPDQPKSFLSIKEVPDSLWEKLGQKKIYFGHKSVGYGLVEGVQDIIKENPQIKLNIIETRNESAFQNPVFAHSPIGKNTESQSKIEDFYQLMEKKIGGKVDIAFFKLCWIDIYPHTDVNQVFLEYKNKIADLGKKYPAVTFLHFSVPLTAEYSGIKGWIKWGKDIIKKVIGKPNVYDNKMRNQYNVLVRREYGDKENFFDLARWESLRPGKSPIGETGEMSEALLAEYTDDGGHLNPLGRKIVAEKFLLCLAQVIQ